MNEQILKNEPYLTRYIESYEEQLPKEQVMAYYQRMIDLYEEAGQKEKADEFRDRLKQYEL